MTVFHSRQDRLTYLSLLRSQSTLSNLPVLAYCLMDNHIHLVVVPETPSDLAEVMQRVHGRYAQYLNARRDRCGHVWQNRYSSCPLGPGHLWTALRYVELNPVRARMVRGAREYEWSSAEAHLSGQDRFRIADMGFWREAGGLEGWRRLLGEPETEEDAKALRRSTYAGQPFGDELFMSEMRVLRSTSPATKYAGHAALTVGS